MKRSLVVVTLVTEGKAYCLLETLAAMEALVVPEEVSRLRFLVVSAGELAEGMRESLVRFRERTGAEWRHEPEPITRWEGDPYWRSLVAAELRERAREALGSRRDGWVLWLDADVLPEPETAVRLLAHGKPAVSGLVLNRLTGEPICGRERRDPATGFQVGSDHLARPGLQEVGWTGLGCFLLRGELARQISYRPYLEGLDPRYPHHMGEDSFVCVRSAELAGEPVLMEGSVTPWHVDASGVALRAHWLGEQLTHQMRLVSTAERLPFLLPRVSGYSHTLGLLEAGKPHRTDARGEALSLAAMRELAAGSQVLELLEPAEG